MDDDDSARNTARERLALTRLLALSDGVFAIALTVLALSLDVPADTDANELGDAIRAELPQLVVYGVSFVAIAMFWLGHHRLYDMVANVDTTLLVANLFGLGLIALIPFPTEVLGTYEDERIAVWLYAATIGTTALVGVWSWVHVLRHDLASERASRSSVIHGILRGLTIAIVFFVSMPIALVSVLAAQLSWGLIVVGHLALARRFGSVYRTHG